MDDPEEHNTPVVSLTMYTDDPRLTIQISRWTEPLSDSDQRPTIIRYAGVRSYTYSTVRESVS
jgi:hypothetical protein